MGWIVHCRRLSAESPITLEDVMVIIAVSFGWPPLIPESRLDLDYGFTGRSVGYGFAIRMPGRA